MKQSAPYFYLQFNYKAYGNVESTEAKALAQISVLILLPSSHPLSFSKTQLLKQNLFNSIQKQRDPFANHAGVGSCLGEAALSLCEFSMVEEAASKTSPAFPLLQGK